MAGAVLMVSDQHFSYGRNFLCVARIRWLLEELARNEAYLILAS